MDEGLGKRLFDFAVRVIKFYRMLPKSKEYDIIKYQFLKSATSSGANYEEAQGGALKADFTNRINISLKEMRGTNYWLRIINEISEANKELENLLIESEELKKILGSIYSKSSKTNKK